MERFCQRGGGGGRPGRVAQAWQQALPPLALNLVLCEVAVDRQTPDAHVSLQVVVHAAPAIMLEIWAEVIRFLLRPQERIRTYRNVRSF